MVEAEWGDDDVASARLAAVWDDALENEWVLGSEEEWGAIHPLMQIHP